MFRKYQTFLVLNDLEDQYEERYDEKAFYINSIKFKCNSNCILAIRKRNGTHFGKLLSHTPTSARYIKLRAKFDHSLMVYIIENYGDDECCQKEDIIPVVGHIYRYGVEPDMSDIVVFNHLIELI